MRAFIIFKALLAFDMIDCVWVLYISLGSKVRPRILGFFTVGICLSSIVSVSWVLYSAGSGVKRVEVDLSGFSISLFVSVHDFMSCR